MSELPNPHIFIFTVDPLMTLESPPELARELPGPKTSKCNIAFFSKWAVHPPKTPAPITAICPFNFHRLDFAIACIGFAKATIKDDFIKWRRSIRPPYLTNVKSKEFITKKV